MNEQSKDIYEAIVKVMSQVGYVQKQKSANLNYTFAGEAALIEALRPYMVENGIFCYVESVSDESFESYQTDKGKLMNMSRLKSTVRFVHAPSGTWIDVQARGQGADSGDKSDNKASTGAYKYALRQTFCIETGDDPDEHSSDEQQAGAPGKTVKPAAKTSPEPLAKPWYATALSQVKGNSKVWEKPLGESPHGEAFIKKLLADHIGPEKWYPAKADFISEVKRITGFATPEEMSWLDAEHLIRAATHERARAGDRLVDLVWQGIFTAEQWASILDGDFKLTDTITADQASMLCVWFASIEMIGVVSANAKDDFNKIVGGK